MTIMQILSGGVYVTAITSGDYTGADTPDPIPNSEVKRARAHDTTELLWWESRTLPD